VKYQSGASTLHQEVLISNASSFRIGDSKFLLTKRAGVAQAKTVITNPVDGSTTLLQGYAKQNA
jgi:hypothetical protein